LIISLIWLVSTETFAELAEEKQPPSDKDIKDLIIRAAERSHILKNPEEAFWDGRRDFRTNSETYLVFDKIPGLKGGKAFYQWKPSTDRILGEEKGYGGKVEVKELTIIDSRNNKKMSGLRIIEGKDQIEAKSIFSISRGNGQGSAHDAPRWSALARSSIMLAREGIWLAPEIRSWMYW